MGLGRKRVALSGGIILLTNPRSPTLAQPPCPRLDVPVCAMGMEQLPHSAAASRKSRSRQRVQQSPERQGDGVSAPQDLTESGQKHSLISDSSPRPCPAVAAGPAALITGSHGSRAADQTAQAPALSEQGPQHRPTSRDRSPSHPGPQAA